MFYECRNCNRRLEELQKLGKAKFCGDFWKCTDCDNDITKDLASWWKDVEKLTKLMQEADKRGGDELFAVS